jgi:hypothetical protein
MSQNCHITASWLLLAAMAERVGALSGKETPKRSSRQAIQSQEG